MINKTALIIVLAGLVFAQTKTETYRSAVKRLSNKPDFSKMTPFHVYRVTDGDTIHINDTEFEIEQPIRLIGVDAPETKDPNRSIEHYGPEASEFLKNLLLGEYVYIIKDSNLGKMDKYLRTLAYVYRAPDGLFVNAEIIRQGYGKSYREYPCKYTEEFNTLEAFAKSKQKGLWSEQSKMLASEIIGYDGIPLGTPFSQIPTYLDKIKGIARSGGKPIFTRVPTKTYYRYNVNRSSDGKSEESEVSLFFKNNKLIQIKDVFGGNYTTEKEAVKKYNGIIEKLNAQWGQPDYQSEGKTTWERNNNIAVLSLELPTTQYGLPIIKLLLWSKEK